MDKKEWMRRWNAAMRRIDGLPMDLQFVACQETLDHIENLLDVLEKENSENRVGR